MKRIADSLLLLVLLLGSATASAASVKLHPLLAGTAHDAYFSIALDGEHGIAVGVLGSIAMTADGGKSWKVESDAPTKLALLGVAMAQSHEVVVGQMGLILTRQGTGGWKKVDSGTTNRLLTVAMNHKGEAVAAGAFGTVLKSSDWGQTWAPLKLDWDKLTDQGMGFEPHLYATNVSDDGVITIAGELGLILRSTDAGQTWKVLHTGDSQKHIGDASIFAMDLSNPSDSFAVGQSGTILHSTDGGQTWESQSSGTKSILLGVGVLPGGKVYVTGMHEMLFSQDAGASWSQVADPEITASWYAGIVAGPVQGTGIAVGHSGRIVRLGG